MNTWNAFELRIERKGLNFLGLSLNTSRVEHITEKIICTEVITLNSKRQIIPTVLNKQESESLSRRAFLRQKKKLTNKEHKLFPNLHLVLLEFSENF